MNMENIVEKRVQEFETTFKRRNITFALDDTQMHIVKDMYRQALREAIVEALESVVPAQRIRLIQAPKHVHQVNGWNACRESLLEKIEALKKV